MRMVEASQTLILSSPVLPPGGVPPQHPTSPELVPFCRAGKGALEGSPIFSPGHSSSLSSPKQGWAPGRYNALDKRSLETYMRGGAEGGIWRCAIALVGGTC